MEELAKLEAERGTPGYLAGDGKTVEKRQILWRPWNRWDERRSGLPVMRCVRF